MKIVERKTLEIELTHEEIMDAVMDMILGTVDQSVWNESNINVNFFVTRKLNGSSSSVELRGTAAARVGPDAPDVSATDNKTFPPASRSDDIGHHPV